ncbi:hypothetical protein EKO04_001496 [Ascochyta lentis]|uniref:Uncharacterized protein n=1 Tax=Ascochyta lentis TaxID=205686 RepID=A0A8H7MKC1_9PLEO|nr:hypothetical protein EKO04_001496 [Ascochyta lentis]
MSFAKHNFSVDVPGAPEFPDSLPPSAQITVPFPVNNHPTWTTYPYAGVDIPATFDNIITPYLPNARLEPVLYAAAVDTIRMTNRYFELVGQYRGTDWPLTEKLVRQKEREWRNKIQKGEDGRYQVLFPQNLFPRPPDLRTLFVKEAMGDPTDDKLNALWIRACKDLHIMSDETRERYLGYTRDELIEKAKLRTDDSWLILEIFKRYLVWWDHVMEQPEDVQPSRAEMEAFFARDDVRTNGATLVEICHAFPYARDVQMLVYRIERFATLQPQPAVKTAAGVDDPVESRYIRHAVPTVDNIKATISDHLLKEGSSISFPELLEQYWPNSGNQQIIADSLVIFAQPDVTTGRFISKHHLGPNKDEIYAQMEDPVNGYTFEDLARRFPNRVWSLAQFEEDMASIAYFDGDEQRCFPLYEQVGDVDPDEERQFMTAEESRTYRNKMRIDLTWDPDTIDDEYLWDLDTLEYVKRSERLQLSGLSQIATTPYEPPSPTEVASTIDRSRSPEPHDPLPSGVDATVQTTPNAPPAAAGPGSPSRAPEPTTEESSRNRPPKRSATEPPEAAKGPKKARTAGNTGKIRCSQHTQKGTRCKKSKDRAEGETSWDCGVHNRSK